MTLFLLKALLPIPVTPTRREILARHKVFRRTKSILIHALAELQWLHLIVHQNPHHLVPLPITFQPLHDHPRGKGHHSAHDPGVGAWVRHARLREIFRLSEEPDCGVDCYKFVVVTEVHVKSPIEWEGE
jgi:hypothetical protein